MVNMVNYITHNSASNFQHVEYNVCGKTNSLSINVYKKGVKC